MYSFLNCIIIVKSYFEDTKMIFFCYQEISAFHKYEKTWSQHDRLNFYKTRDPSVFTFSDQGKI